VILDAALAGALLGGQSAAATALPVAVAPPEHRSQVVAAYSTVSGLAFGAATLAGGLVASRLPFFVVIADQLFVAKKLVFVAGGAVRLVAAFLGYKLLRAFD
jgi:hypothetical protein